MKKAKLLRVKGGNKVGLLITRAQAKLLFISVLRASGQESNPQHLAFSDFRITINNTYPDLKIPAGDTMDVVQRLREVWNEDHKR